MATGVVTEERATSGHRTLQSVVLGLAVGFGLGVASVALAFAVVAVPIYFAGFDDGGLDPDLVRMGLFAFAAPVGAVVGSVGGVLVARWYARGAPLPDAAGR
jgi:hypothetical protein